MTKQVIAYLPVGRYLRNQDLSRKVMDQTLVRLRSLDADILAPLAPITTAEALNQMIQMSRSSRPDLYIVQHTTCGDPAFAPRIAIDLDRPILLWATPEPPLDNGVRVKSESLVGAIVYSSVLAKAGKNFRFVLGLPEDETTWEAVLRSIQLVNLWGSMRTLKVGLVGYRAPGFVGVSYDETSLLTTFGIEVVHISLTELFHRIEDLDPADVRSEAQVITASVGAVACKSDQGPEKAAKLYLGLKRITSKEQLQAVAVKCWPELRGESEICPCAALSRLSGEGIMAACEGDVLGAVMMYIGYHLSGEPPFIADLAQIDPEANTVLFSHCGNAPTCLASDKQSITLNDHFATGYPATMEFSLKPGRVTVAQLDKSRHYRMAFSSGEIIPCEMVVRGSTALVKMDQEVHSFLENVVYQGLPHHSVIIYGDVGQELRDLCKWLDIEVVSTQT